MITTNKFNDPNLTEEEQDAIVGAFVRQRENKLLRQRWEAKLSKEHGVDLPGRKRKRPTIIRSLTVAVLAIAASLLLVFVVLPSLSGPSGDELLAGYLEEANIRNTRNGIAANTLDSLRIAFSTDFFREDYAAAVVTGQTIAGTTTADANDAYNLGLAQLRASDNAAAISTFRSLLAQDSNLKTESRFYLAIALLQAGQTEAALGLLGEIKASDGVTIYEKAQALLQQGWE